MKVCDFIVVLCCPVLTAAKLSQKNVESTSSIFRTVELRPPKINKIKIKEGMQHMLECIADCLLDVSCLTTVFDEGLGQCSVFDSSNMTETLGIGETGLMKEVSTTQVTCIALEYNKRVDGCVQLFTTPKNWADAEAECQSIHHKSHLVAITDFDKQEALNALADSVGVTKYFTSGQASTSEPDVYLWSSTGELVTNANWMLGELGLHEQECITIQQTPSKLWKWNKSLCSTATAFFCEMV